MVSCPICGPRLSICYTLLSIWGIIQLGLLGVFFQVHSPALFEDLPIDEEKWKHEGNFSAAYLHEKYEQNAVNCFIACGLYILLFIFSFTQQRMNSKANQEVM